MRPVLDPSSFVSIPTLSCKPATILLLAFSLFESVASSVFLFKKALFTIITAPKRNSSDAGSTSKAKRSHDALSISEKVKILDMMEIEKKSYTKMAKLYGKNESSIRQVM